MERAEVCKLLDVSNTELQANNEGFIHSIYIPLKFECVTILPTEVIGMGYLLLFCCRFPTTLLNAWRPFLPVLFVAWAVNLQ